MSTIKTRFKGIDGLRTFAIWMVLAGHNGMLAPTAGGIGNKIFFTLCGFFACYSMRHVFNGKDALRFYWKKIVRIVPAYWIVVLVIWRMIPGFFSLGDLFTDKSLILNMFFIRGYGHLWFTQQIMLMYLCTPLLHLLLSGLSRGYRRVIPKAGNLYPSITAAILIVLAFLEKRYFTSDILHMSGEGTHTQFQIWMFFFGYASAVLCMGPEGDHTHGGSQKCSEPDVYVSPRKKTALVITDLYMLFFFVVLLMGVIPEFRSFAPSAAAFLDGEVLRTVMACAAVFLLTRCQESLAAGFLSRPVFHFFSELSYEIYLIHFFFLGMFRTGNRVHDLLSNMLISVAFAFLLHTGINRVRTRIRAAASVRK